MDVRGVQREQPYWGPKEKASQRLVGHAFDAASEEPRPCATRSQSIVQPFHDSARAPRMRALAKPKCKAVARAALKPAYLSHCLLRAAARAVLSAQCKAAIFSPTVREEPFLQPHVAESTTIPSQFRTFPCIVPPSQKTAARAALSAHCKAVAKAALKRAYRSHCTPRAAARAALSAQCKAVARAALKPAQRQPSPH